MARIQIRSNGFTLEQASHIILAIKETGYDSEFQLDLVASSDEENVDITFSLEEEDLGPFIEVIFHGGIVSSDIVSQNKEE